MNESTSTSYGKYARKWRSWPSGWILRNGSSRGQGVADGRRACADDPDRRRGWFLRLDDLAIAGRQGLRRATEGRLGSWRNPRGSGGVGRKRRGAAPGGGGTGGASRFYRTAARATKGGRAVGKAATLMLLAETGRGCAA